MQSQNRVFEDLSKVATSAMGTMAGVGREVETMIRGRVRELVGGFDMVDRDEFEAVKAMAATARADAEALKAELAELRAMMAAAQPAAATAAAAAATAAAATDVPPAAGGSAPIV
ncbi:MAG: accessory factor UbiK family protein [Janthinobacterium lividum]